MKIPKLVTHLALAVSLLLLPIPLNAENAKPKIQIAILLDSSNSMDGLIDQTKTQLWDIVNALSTVTKNGQIPVLEVALYHYGNDSLPSSEGFTRLLNQFTPELDRVSEQLFTIKTNGGEEYTGYVVKSAMNQLQWSKNPQDFRVIFIAGNEPFDQGNISWRDAIAQATQKDTIVNTIYCGEAENTERTLWAQGANLGHGSNFNINQNQEVVTIPTPYDQQIIDLNQKLNTTYVPYGEEGVVGQQRQVAEDANAQENAATRGISKASSYYRNSSWDLVDAFTDGTVNLRNLDNTGLPSNMQGMTLEQKQEYITSLQTERAAIQAQIRDLSAQRDAYIQSHITAPEAKDTLDYVMIQALRQQLAAKGFTLR